MVSVSWYACVCGHKGPWKGVCARVYTTTEKQCAFVVKMGDPESGCLGLMVTSALAGPLISERLLPLQGFRFYIS